MPQNNISLVTAQTWARNFRRNPANVIIGQLIPRVDLEQLLACPAGQDVRVYYGEDEHGQQKLMFVSVDAAGKDLVDDKAGQLIYDHSQPCPPNKDINSPLYAL